MVTDFRPGYSGTGPGEITPDGCAVELYRRLPVDNSAIEAIVGAVSLPASLLELGCGVGRMTRPLAAAGFEVTAVDESAAMLAHVTGARRVVQSPVERVEVEGRFDVVLMASFLVHAGDPVVRRGLLGTCRKHVADDGLVIVQREPEDLHELPVPRQRPLLDGHARIVSATDVGDGVLSIHFEYAFPDATWTQTFLSRPLTRAQFEEALEEAGLRLDRYLTEDHTWAAARPI
jgi:SAM-dependent methyltransferase